MIIIIKLYKRISPWVQAIFHQVFGYNSGCRFSPTCSIYTAQAIKKYGLLKGPIKAIWRVIRCNPWCKGGVDTP